MKALLTFFVVLIGSLPIPCAAGPALSDKEAARIIREHFGYPIAVSVQIKFKEKSREMLDYLKQEGYIVDLPAQTCCGDFYSTTEKGKRYLGDFVKYLSNRYLYVDCVYAKKALKSIEAIHADAKKKGATVVYIEGLEPNETVCPDLFRKGQEGTQEIDLNKTKRITVELIYGSKGWRVEEYPDGR